MHLRITRDLTLGWCAIRGHTPWLMLANPICDDVVPTCMVTLVAWLARSVEDPVLRLIGSTKTLNGYRLTVMDLCCNRQEMWWRCGDCPFFRIGFSLSQTRALMGWAALCFFRGWHLGRRTFGVVSYNGCLIVVECVFILSN
jgi:hypothetical protein